MSDYFLNMISFIDSSHIKLFILSMAPVTELRFSIPYGIFATTMEPEEVVLISIIGNIIIGICVLYIIGPIMTILQKISFFDKIVTYIFKRSIKKGKIIDRIKFWGLVIFVGIPLPFTGVWTGALSSYLFNIPKSRSILAIIIGVFISATIVTTISLISK